MKKNFTVNMFIVMFILYALVPSKLNATLELPSAGLDSELTVSMDFKDTSLKEVLKAFSMQSGLNFIASEAVQERRVTLYLDNVPFKKAMDKLFKANNLSYELDRGANILIVKDWGSPGLDTVTKVFYLKYASVSSSSLQSERSSTMQTESAGSSEGSASVGLGIPGMSTGEGGSSKGGITKAIEKLLSKGGSIIEDPRTNSLIVTDSPQRMPVITQVIASLDIPVAQVMLEVEMLDVSKNTIDALGVKFGQTPITLNTLLTGATVPTKFPWGSLFGDMQRSLTLGNFSVNSATASSYQVLIDFLKTRTDTKYLARPRILTLNNETAEIKITTQETIGVTIETITAEGTAGTQTGVPERAETGVSLRVTPQINPDTGEITMFIVPTVKDTSTSTFLTTGGSGSQYFKDPEERSTKSSIRVGDGETVILGGLIRKESTETITKLPFFGDIPLLGSLLFTHKDKSKDKERELLVFITPHIIQDANMKLAQTKKDVLPEREQGIASRSSRDLAITSILNTFEKRKR